MFSSRRFTKHKPFTTFAYVLYRIYKRRRKLNVVNSKGRGFDSHLGQTNFSACPVWMHTQSNITDIIFTLVHNHSPPQSEFLVKLRNITWETNYVIVSQNALGMMGRRTHPPSRTTKCPLLSLHYPYNPI
jgi:hypothetical protein